MLKYAQRANASDSVERDVEEVLASGRTPFQEYLFFRSPTHGTCVVLDGDVQSCESDEGVYHEALVHPAMLLHPDPRQVLIMGGGEGATAREVLRHPGVESVVMVDIDREFVELCRRYIPDWSNGVWEDSRLTVRYEDINGFLAESATRFDVVIGDLVDVHDWNSPVASLYGENFYTRLTACLNVGAIVATQGGALGTVELEGHNHIRRTLGRVFDHVTSYGVVVPSFYHLWGYVVASDTAILNDPAETERRILEASSRPGLAIEKTGADALAAAFRLPRHISVGLV